jgi:transposase-like protein
MGLTAEQRAEIVRRYVLGESAAALAAEFDVSRQWVSDIVAKAGHRKRRGSSAGGTVRQTFELPAGLMALIDLAAARNSRSRNLEVVEALRAHYEKKPPQGA